MVNHRSFAQQKRMLLLGTGWDNKAMSHTFEDPNVAHVFAAFLSEARVGQQYLRKLIFDVAARTEGVGSLEETLKWGQPAYLTLETKQARRSVSGVPKRAASRSMCIVRPASCQISARSFPMIFTMKATGRSTSRQRRFFPPRSSSSSSYAY